VLEVGSEPVAGFRLQSRLGVGAFGQVWEARTADGGSVALKFIDSRRKDASLLRAEIRILRAVSEPGHPNLIRLLGVYASSYYLVVCMEKADGNLEELRLMYRELTGRNVAPDHLLELLAQVAQGLDYLAHIKLAGFNQASAGLQHCDVKPSNLLIKDEVVKIADFGLCAAMGQQTHKQGCRGTPPYAAPELYHGRASPSTDQYSLAVTYCDLVAGERIVGSNASGEHNGQSGIDLTKVRGRERPVLERALSPDPSRRWPNCESFIEALREVAVPFRIDKDLNARPARPALARPMAPAGTLLGSHSAG
jgi:serine/threonine protein kinase, bacterial